MSKVSPQRFGKYILLRRLALGGMAEIFKAKVAGAEGFEKDLVIKRILPHFSEDDSFIQMFIDEARITAKLQHPNIVQIFDFDVVEGSYYIAMEYIEGKDLKDLIEESLKQKDPISVAQCVWIATEVSKGLHYAHTKEEKGQPLNIVHRDVTPSNVMLSYRGDVKLMDFGIAKAAQRSTKTQAGAVKGKVAYMSPEQARGKQIDGRTDIFALGVMLWEMLTGRRLFLADSDFETLNNVLRMDAPPPSSINPDVPTDLDPIVAKCIAKDPAQRWSSAEALGRELTRWYYSHVIDLEKEKLKPLMYRVFKKDLDALEKDANEDEAFMQGGAVALNSESTAVQPASRTASGPVSEQKTRMDMAAAESVPRTGTNQRPPPDRTATRSRTSQGTATGQQGWQGAVAPQKQKSVLPWIVLALLLLGGGGAAVFFLTRGGGGTTPGPGVDTAASVDGADATGPKKETATLYLKVDPHMAKVKVDGTVVGGEVPGLEVGQKVRVVAEAPGYKRFEEIIAIEDSAPVFAVKMEKEGVPHRIVIKPAGDTDEVFVNDERLGRGAQNFEGVLGQDLVIKVVPGAGGTAVTKAIQLDASMTIVSVTTPGELTISVDPAEAAITASAGTITVKSPGLVSVTGLDIGTSVEVEAKADGFKALKQTVNISQSLETLTMRLEKLGPAGPVLTGKGTIKIGARPWAQVTVNGKPYGTTPQTLKDMPAGRYTVVLTKGAQKVTKSVAVGGGKSAEVFVDFTSM